MTGGGLPALRLSADLVLAPPLLLAPMEGVTDPSFRSLVLESGPVGCVGAACTEFQRVTQTPIRLKQLRAALGPRRPEAALGLQLMAREAGPLAATAALAGQAGADFLDLNFGCPAPRVFQHCAGSALLADPPQFEALIRAAVAACPLPVTVKIRAGVDHDRDLEELAQRAEAAGAAALTVHARLRTDHYQDPATWSRIHRAVQAVAIPVIGNGNADSPTAIDRMFAETGCAGVMVGRGALANPWIFADWADTRAGRTPRARTRGDIAVWMHEYARRMAAGGTTARAVCGRLKQAARALAAAGRLLEPARLPAALREREAQAFLAEVGLGLPAAGTRNAP
ncbi:MAG TPA: tRNA-dihydrouridine synthase family protein [Planctomycetota bacterium]